MEIFWRIEQFICGLQNINWYWKKGPLIAQMVLTVDLYSVTLLSASIQVSSIKIIKSSSNDRTTTVRLYCASLIYLMQLLITGASYYFRWWSSKLCQKYWDFHKSVQSIQSDSKGITDVCTKLNTLALVYPSCNFETYTFTKKI